MKIMIVITSCHADILLSSPSSVIIYIIFYESSGVWIHIIGNFFVLIGWKEVSYEGLSFAYSSFISELNRENRLRFRSPSGLQDVTF